MKKVKLKDIANISAGQTAPQGNEQFGEIGYPFIRAGHLIDLINGLNENQLPKINDNIAKNYKLKLYPKNSILFAKSGMSCMKGYVYVLKNDCYIVSHLAIITPTKSNSQYLKYYFIKNAPNKLIKDKSYPSIPLKDIANIEIRIPNIDEQEKIVEKLDKIEELIDLRKTQLDKLDLLIKAKFNEMFGDIKLPYTNEDFTLIKDIAMIVSGSTPKTKEEKNWNGKFNWITPAEIKDTDFIIYNTQRTITEDGAKSCSLKLLPVNTILLSSRAPIGKVAIVGKEMYCNQGFKNLICNNKIHPYYMYFLLKYNSDYLNSIGRGATFKEISKSILENVQIYVPPIELQNQFAQFVDKVNEIKDQINENINSLTLLQKQQMQKYFG